MWRCMRGQPKHCHDKSHQYVSVAEREGGRALPEGHDRFSSGADGLHIPGRGLEVACQQGRRSGWWRGCILTIFAVWGEG
jgi:hypothetical protein